MWWKIMAGAIIAILILLAVLEIMVVGAAALAIGGVIVLTIAITSIMTKVKKKRALQ